MPSGSPPSVLVSGAAQTPEGQRYLLNLTAVDPENDPVTGWTINWGDGNVQTLSGNPSSVAHTYAAGPNAYAITASAVADGVSFAAHVADDGRFLGTFVAPGSGGLAFPRWMTFGPDGNLYVITSGVLRYDGATGVPLPAPGRSGAEFVPAGSPGLHNPMGLAFGPDGALYVADTELDPVVPEYRGSVLRYDALTGSSLGVFVPQKSGGLEETMGLTFGPDGNLYVADSLGQARRYDGQTGAFLGLFSGGVSGQAGTALQFGPDGSLYVNDVQGARVQRYDGATGAFRDTFIPSFYGNTIAPYGMTFGPDGDFYLASSQANTSDSTFNRVVRYDAGTGELIDVYAAGPEQDRPFFAVFGADGNLYVSSSYNDSILRYSGPLTAGATTQLPVTVLDVWTATNPTKQNITNFKTIRSTLTVPDTFTVADVNVTVDIDHSNDADLDVYLISPAGTRVELFTDVGGSGDNFRFTTVDDEARLPFSSGVAPFTGAFYPEGRGVGRLSAFDGQAAHGTWTLEITDDASGNTGKFKSWRLDLARAAAPLRAESVGAAEPSAGLTPEGISPILAEALNRWQATGAEALTLRGIDVQVTDLSGDYLALTTGTSILLDRDAAGWGWFIDPTPYDDREFTTPGDQGEQNRMDLLTVLMHELGHVLGLEHEDGDGVMAEALSAGARQALPATDTADTLPIGLSEAVARPLSSASSAQPAQAGSIRRRKRPHPSGGLRKAARTGQASRPNRFSGKVVNS